MNEIEKCGLIFIGAGTFYNFFSPDLGLDLGGRGHVLSWTLILAGLYLNVIHPMIFRKNKEEKDG